MILLYERAYKPIPVMKMKVGSKIVIGESYHVPQITGMRDHGPCSPYASLRNSLFFDTHEVFA